MAGERALTGETRELARAAGLARDSEPTLAELDRRRAQLWILSTLVVLTCIGGAIFLIAGRDLLPEFLSDNSATAYIGAGLVVALGAAFVGYTIEKERMLRRLAENLVQERQRADRLSQIDELRRDSVTTTVHDLKTPLTSILGAAKTLRKKMDVLDPNKAAELLGSIEKQSLKMTDLINSVLDTSRIESGALQLRREKIDMRDLAADVIGDLLASPLGRGRDVRIEMEPERPSMWGDPLATQQIIGNLVENALKYGMDPVTFEVRDLSAEIVLSVRDMGPGIPDSELGSLFDRFKRVGAPQTEGSGLGLYIVGNLVEAQGGRVAVESDEGTETVFTVRFPKRSSDRTVDITT